jgi:hypothetical protein
MCIANAPLKRPRYKRGRDWVFPSKSRFKNVVIRLLYQFNIVEMFLCII